MNRRLVGVLLVVLSGCGDVELATGEARGRIYAATPLAGGVTIHARGVRPSGYPAECGDTVAAADGTFNVPLGTCDGTIILEVEGTGGSFVEPATGATVTTSPGIVLRAMVTGLAPGDHIDGVLITPLTTLAASLAEARLARGREATLAEAADRANALIGDHFGNVVVSVGEIAVLGGPTSYAAPVRYALVLAGLSELAADIGAQTGFSTFTTMDVVAALAADLASPEALFDGASVAGPAVIPACAALPLCHLDADTPRPVLARHITAFLRRPANATGLAYADIAAMAAAMAASQEPELFGTAPGPLDPIAPQVTISLPTPGQVLVEDARIVATATDDTTVTSLTVSIDGLPLPPVAGNPAVFDGTFDTAIRADGPVTIAAEAIDVFGNASQVEVTATTNNAGAGVKGPVEGATVTAYRVGAPPTVLGAPTTTGSNGAFVVTGVEGYSGLVLIECTGAGSYDEEAYGAVVSLDDNALRTLVVLSDGIDLTGVAVTPWTTLAVELAYARATQNGVSLQAGLAAALAQLGEHLDVGTLGTIPADLAVVASLNEGGRHAVSLAGFSELSRRLAVAAGVTPGAGLSSLDALAALEEDIADGCLDGRGATGPVSLLGVPLVAETLRYDLAAAVAGFLDGGYDPTVLTSTAALVWLDGIASSGPTSDGDPLACAPGDLFPAPGAPFDRAPPAIVWESAPEDGSVLIDVETIRARAVDTYDPHPIIGWDPLTDLTDLDGLVNEVVVASVDPAALPEGVVAVGVEAEDANGNLAASTRQFAVDRTAPWITLETPPPAYARGTFSLSAVIDDDQRATLGGSLPDSPATLSATVTPPDDVPAPLVSSTRTRTSDGRVHVALDLTATAENDGLLSITFFGRDWAGNLATQSVSTTIDHVAPQIIVTTSAGWTNDSTPTVAGYLTDSSPIDTLVGTFDSSPAVVSRSGNAFTMTPSSALSDGAHVLNITATDAAGNTASLARPVQIDTQSPSLALTTSPANTIIDDMNVDVTFNSNAVPAFSTPSPSINLAATTAPTVNKFVQRLIAHESGEVSIHWHTNASDVGSGVAAVTYTLTSPSAVVYGPFTAVSDSGHYTSYATRQEITAAADSLSPLQSQSGTWSVSITVRDSAGNATSLTRSWNHVPLGSPVQIQKATDLGDPLAGTIGLGTLEANTMAYSINSSGGRNSFVRYRLRNGTPYATYVGFFFPSLPSDCTGLLANHSLAITSAPLTVPSCGLVGDMAWRINADGTTTCSGAGWTLPTDTHSNVDMDCALTFGVRLFAEGGGAGETRCTTGGCATTFAGGTYYEFLVPGTTTTTPQVRWVSIEGDLRAFSPVGRTELATEFALAGRSLTGLPYEEYGRCWETDNISGHEYCVSSTAHRRYQAVHWASMSVPNMRVSVRARPALTASPSNIAQEYMDGYGAALDVGTLSYYTCEGTTTGGSCTPSPP